jgi:hypothetical protein
MLEIPRPDRDLIGKGLGAGGKQVAAVCPPSPRADGTPRRWNGIWEIAPCPEVLVDVEGLAVPETVQAWSVSARIIDMACRVSVKSPDLLRGKKALVIEDGPTLTHGEIPLSGKRLARNAGVTKNDL